MIIATRRGISKLQKGQALIELALVLPIFFVLVFGIVDIGRYIYMSHAVVEAAYEGARVAGIYSDPWYQESPAPDPKALADVRANEVLANYAFINLANVTSFYDILEYGTFVSDPSGNPAMRIEYSVSHPFSSLFISLFVNSIGASASARAEITHHEPIIIGGGEEEEEGGPGEPV